jgi:hypothetical protein
MLLNDSNGFLSLLGFNGNEYLIFTFSKPGLEDKIKKVFRIFKVSHRQMTKDQNENYILHFTSEETVLSEQYKVCKSYPNKKVSEMVSDILLNQLLVRPEKFYRQTMKKLPTTQEI